MKMGTVGLPREVCVSPWKLQCSRSGVEGMDHCQIKGRTNQYSVIGLLSDRKDQGETGPFLMETTCPTCTYISSLRSPPSPYGPRTHGRLLLSPNL